MNYEQAFRPKDNEVTSRQVVKACRKFANILASGQWRDSENRGLSITRSFQEVIGHEGVIAPSDITFSPITIETEVSFLARKNPYVVDIEGRQTLAEEYIISAAVTETIPYSEVPKELLAGLDDAIDVDDMGIEYSVPLAEQPEILQKIVFERQHELTYEIDAWGEIDDYSIIVRYIADDCTIDERVYSWSDDAQEYRYEPTGVVTPNEEVYEWRRATLSKMTEDDISQFLKTFEKIIENVSDAEEFEQITDEIYIGEDEHCRRILGMIAMVSVGFAEMK